MKKIILTIVASCMLCITSSAQESITPFIKELPQRANFNPSFDTDNNAYFVLPGLGGCGVNIENSGFSWEDLFFKGKDGKYNMDFDRLSSRMRKLNLTSVGVNIPIVEVGVRTSNNYVTFGLTNRTTADVVIPRSLTDLRFGNYDYDRDRVVNNSISDVYVRGMNYFETTLGFRRDVNRLMRFGIRFKYLSGVASVFSDNLKININTVNEDNRYRLDIETHGSIYASAPVAFTTDKDGYVDGTDTEEIDASYFKPTKNRGFAIDLGGTLNMFRNITLGLGVTDLGFIKWKNNTHRLSAGNSYSFRGVNIDDKIKDNADREDNGESYWDQVLDSLEQFTDVTYKGGTKFKTRLSGKIYATAEVNLLRWLSANGLVSTKTVYGHTYTQITADLQLHPKKWFTWALSGTMNHGAQMSFGTGMVLTGGAFQFYLLADRLPFNIAKTNGLCFSTGINFVLGRSKNIDEESGKSAPGNQRNKR